VKNNHFLKEEPVGLSMQFHSNLLLKNHFHKPYQNPAFSVTAKVFPNGHQHKIEVFQALEIVIGDSLQITAFP
jgi:hypothetical protein